MVAVDRSPQKELSRPLLASMHGGDIVVKQDQQASLIAQDAVFRVIVKPLGGAPKPDAVIHGSVRIETGLRFVVENFVYRILSVLHPGERHLIRAHPWPRNPNRRRRSTAKKPRRAARAARA